MEDLQGPPKDFLEWIGDETHLWGDDVRGAYFENPSRDLQVSVTVTARFDARRFQAADVDGGWRRVA